MMRSHRSDRARIGGVIVLLIVLPLGCRHVPVEKAAPVLTPVPGSGVSAERLEAGRAIYVSGAKCARCHSPKPVYEHTADDWTKTILPKMAKNSKLTPDEYQSVLAYVTVGAAQPSRHGSSP